MRTLQMRNEAWVLKAEELTSQDDACASASERPGPIVLVISDGTCSWRGRISPEQLTPPLSVDARAFATRLLQGLRGAEEAHADLLDLTPVPSGRRLTWKAELASEGPLAYKLRLKQTVLCEPEEPQHAGELLQDLLVTLVQGLNCEQDLCVARVHESAAIKEEEIMLNDAEGEAWRMETQMLGSVRESMLAELNATKRRIVTVESALERWERGDDGFAGVISQDSDGDSTDYDDDGTNAIATADTDNNANANAKMNTNAKPKSKPNAKPNAKPDAHTHVDAPPQKRFCARRGGHSVTDLTEQATAAAARAEGFETQRREALDGQVDGLHAPQPVSQAEAEPAASTHASTQPNAAEAGFQQSLLDML